MKDENRKYTYGPVPSRRLGISLGVDLVPHKVCSYDCIYCQLGRTTELTIERKDHFPVSEIVQEVEDILDEGAPIDFITLAGSGEPTLNSGLGEIISGIKAISSLRASHRSTDIPLALLTNGSLFWDDDVRRDALKADLIIPSLDAGDEGMFAQVNRPHQGISFGDMVGGLEALRRDFAGEIWLEVFLIGGLTGTREGALKMSKHIERINPDRVQVNTTVRPPAEDFAPGLSMERLFELAPYLADNAEPVADVAYSKVQHNVEGRKGEIVGLLKRRPSTVDDIASSLGIHRNEVIKYLKKLEEEDIIERKREGDRVFYRAKVSNLHLTHGQ